MVRDMLYLRASINGSRSLWFNLDTGASHTSINPDVAEQIGLRETGSGDAFGIGHGESERFGRVEGAAIRIGDIVLRGQSLVTLSTGFLAPQLGHATDGTLGWNLFHRYAVRIDYAGGKLEFDDPAHWDSARAGVAVPIEVRDNIPFVRAAILLANGQQAAGDFLIDIGMIGAGLSLNEAFRRAHPELLALRSIPMPDSTAVGGKRQYRLTRVRGLNVGPFTLRGLITVLPMNSAGTEADPNIAGLIGADALSRFTVSFDYAHAKMYLAPNRHFGEPFETDMSGLEVTANPPQFDRFEVSGVMAESPAGQAGVRQGDVIAEVDGRPASRLALADIQTSFEKPGETRHLLLERGKEELRIELHLKRLI